MSPKTKRRLRIAALLLGIGVVAVPIAWLVAPGLLTVDTGLPRPIQWPSTFNSQPASAPIDTIVVLGGEPWTRPQRAADVYAEVVGKMQKAETTSPEHPSTINNRPSTSSPASPSVWVLASGHGDCEDVRRQLEARNVPADVIETECKSISTFENAGFSVKLLRERHATNVVIVTSWYHSRRALASFQDAAPELHFYSKPTIRPVQKSWWPNKYERDRILREYAKVLYYWVVHGVSPFV